jgi:hypothetical protein
MRWWKEIRLLGYRFSTRITSCALVAQACWPGLAGRLSLKEVIRRAPTVDGLSDLNLTLPDHLGNDPVSVGRRMRACGVQLSGLAMRCRTNPGYRPGAFTTPDRAVGRESIDQITPAGGVRRNVPDGARGSIPGHADRPHPSWDPAQRVAAFAGAGVLPVACHRDPHHCRGADRQEDQRQRG